MPRRRYKAHEVGDLRQRLREAESAAKPAGYTTREVVREVADELRTMLADKNYTVAGVAKFLSDNGVQIGHRTLGQYLRDEGVVRSRRKRGAKGKAMARMQSPADAVGSEGSRAPHTRPDAAIAAETRARAEESAQDGARAPEALDVFDQLGDMMPGAKDEAGGQKPD